ncbi:MAG: MFS transporter [Candidatus Marinimicrobia bacterium]|nr:MFS transporter [Candidatus Neomarinimicrobiota bacterium]
MNQRQNNLKNLKLVSLTLLMLSCLFSQALLASGIIRGRIFDEKSKDVLSYANIVIKGTSIGSPADQDGEFSIPNAPSGTQTIVVSYIGYETMEVVINVPENNKVIFQEIGLKTLAIKGQEVVVTAQGLGQIQAINQQLASDKISSIVSEARIQELPDFNAAAALSRLPGVSTLESSGEASKVVIRGLAPQYYIEYYVKNQNFSFLGKEFIFSYKGITSTFMMSGTVMTIIAVLLTPYMSKKLGKAAVYRFFLGLAAISTGLVIFLKPENLVMLFTLQFVTSFAVGPVSVTQWAIYTDTADYSEWKKNRRATGLVMSASLFALKLGIALGVSCLAWILAAHGYIPNAEQTAQGLLGIRMVMSVYPAVAGLIGMGFMIFYPLNHEIMDRIEKDLIERRARE